MKKTRTVVIYLVLALLIAAGAAVAVTHFAGGQKVNISGNITRDGKPLEWKSDAGQLSVVFLPKVRDNTTHSYRAQSDRSGRFDIKDIPTGTYIVSIQQLDPDGAHDLLGMTYDPSSTPLEYEVTQDGQQFPIDLPKVLPKRRTAPPRMPPGPQRNEPKPDDAKKDDADKKPESK